jgi:hypothetical protein
MSEDIYGHAFHVGIMPTLQNEDIIGKSLEGRDLQIFRPCPWLEPKR